MVDNTQAADESQELAALFALGMLTPDEAAECTAQVQAGDPVAEDLRAFERVVPLLGHGATPVSPPPRLRDRLLTRLRGTAEETPQHSASPETASEPSALGPSILRAHEGLWNPGFSPGMLVKTLFLDAARQYATQLVHITPGAHIAPHGHPEAEECYVIEGSFRVDTYTFQAGDYVRMPAGSQHNTIISDTGCLLLVMGSTTDASAD